jgi:transglutaminase-like putative cysteine protease
MLVHQDYRLEGGALHLYAILPLISLKQESGDLSVAPVSNRILRIGAAQDDQPVSRTFQFAALTSSLRNGRQLHGVPNRNRNLEMGDRARWQNDRELLLQFDPARFEGLAAAAERVISEAGMVEAGPLEQALTLERHFTESGLYRYSLNLNFQRDPRLDPIEDFVVNHRTGHCEYFASALVMMLRSRGIPARMILGYKGGDFNTIGDYYQVRQKHSHAWVEALLPAGVTPEWELAGPPSAGGTWYRLDPTPDSDGTQASSSEEGLADRVMQTFDYVELLWRDYVLSLNATRQRDSIYDPMNQRTVASLPPWVEGRGIRRWMNRFARWVGVDPRSAGLGRGSEAQVFDWRSGALLTAVLVGLVLIGNGIFWLWRRWTSRWNGSFGEPQSRRPVAPAFYRRLEALLAKLPLRRATGETARELADAAAIRLREGALHTQAAELPREIVEAYYRVRFGGTALDSHEQAAIEHALAALTPAVHQAHR